MKNIGFITALMMLIVNVSNGQKYIDGHNVISMLSIANSSILQGYPRLTMEQANTKLLEIDPNTIRQTADDMIGEYWWIDSMLVNIIPREITVNYPKEDMKDIQLASTPTSIPRRDGSKDMTLVNDYFTELKSVNDFKVLVDYYKTRSTRKNFIIQDNLDRYEVQGCIYVKKTDSLKAHVFIDSLLNSITFK
ncbi:hypothetical protein G5B00_11410 [Parapedobacter sp. SGR-10]|uniref:hypothetical protein n=1 Tax=Parapedobacter sp. SGR-10 TaxID=2710879 RepID=UPI0013D88496|nr:hypothetical protein [Parapedobacter sp. SGR-10]NGF57121.1 hypothetical protein [Parapedobacter sp. SGR-10]